MALQPWLVLLEMQGDAEAQHCTKEDRWSGFEKNVKF
jgi:hypothetical protein